MSLGQGGESHATEEAFQASYGGLKMKENPMALPIVSYSCSFVPLCAHVLLQFLIKVD